MARRMVIVGGVSLVVVSSAVVLMLMKHEHRQVAEEVRKKELELQALRAELWKKRIFWMKLVGCLAGAGGIAYSLRSIFLRVRILV